jgi:hypothetical protein
MNSLAIYNSCEYLDYLRERGEQFLDVIFDKMDDSKRSRNLTCIHIRRGDKVRGWNKGSSSVYNPWALSIEFYMKAMEYAR